MKLELEVSQLLGERSALLRELGEPAVDPDLLHHAVSGEILPRTVLDDTVPSVQRVLFRPETRSRAVDPGLNTTDLALAIGDLLTGVVLKRPHRFSLSNASRIFFMSLSLLSISPEQ